MLETAKGEKMYNLEIVTNWWADKISGNVRHDNGALNEAPSAMACILADLLVKPITEEQLETFKAVLEERLIEQLSSRGRVDLYCDYGPDIFLREAAEKANIPTVNFPFKTGMYIEYNGDVRVKEGYACPYTTIGRVDFKNE